MSRAERSSDLDRIFERADQLIREGQVQAAAELIDRLIGKQVPLSHLAEYGRLCARSGLIRKGLLTLKNLVNDSRDDEPSSDPEIEVSYSLLLQRQGSVDEALRRLARMKAAADYDDRLWWVEGLCHLSRWDWLAASESFINYAALDLEPYDRLLANVNLLAALVMSPHPEPGIESLAKDCMSQARAQSYFRLLGNVLESFSQHQMEMGRFAEAGRLLQEAEEFLDADTSQDLFFVRKWQAVLESRQRKNVEPLLKLRQLVRQESRWESLRSVDLNILKIQMDDRRFRHLYVGSPMPKFREKICIELKVPAPDPGYLYGKPSSRELNLGEGTFDGKQVLKPGQLSLRLLTMVMADFYKPKRAGELCALLFPDEDFDPQLSLDRLQKVLARTRRELSAAGIPLSVMEENGFYPLRMDDACCISVESEREPASKEAVLWVRLLKSLGGSSTGLSAGSKGTLLTGPQIQELLSLPKSSARRFIQYCLENKLLISSGKGKATIYRIAGKVD